MFLARHPLLHLYLWCTDVLSRLVRRPAQSRQIRKILLSNLGHLGDVVLATTALAEITRAYPGCEVGFLGTRSAATVLAGHPRIKRVHVFAHWRIDGTGLLSSMASLVHTVRELRQAQYDLALDIYPYYPNGALALALAGIPQRAGFTSGGWGGLYTIPVDWTCESKHIVRRFRDVLVAAGISCDPEIVFSLQGGEKRADLPKHYVVVHMGSRSRAREWEPAKWKEVVRAMALPVVLTGAGEREHALAAAVGTGINLVNKLSWNDFVGCIQHAHGVLCAETAAGHIAAAFAVPCVYVMPGINDPVVWGSCSPIAMNVSEKTSCAPCGRARGCASMACLRGITAHDVLQAWEALMAQRTGVATRS